MFVLVKLNTQENLEAAKVIKPLIGEIPLLVVGGLRRVAHMEEVIKNGFADFISMSRPFIREPNIVKKIIEGKVDSVSCVSCSKCFAAAANYMPVYCHQRSNYSATLVPLIIMINLSQSFLSSFML